MKSIHVADDEGNALLVAVMIVSVALSLVLVAVTQANSATRASGVDRQRLVAVNAAEAGVDEAYVGIESSGTLPPCSLTTSDVQSGPDTTSYATTVQYLDASGNVVSDASCGLSGTPAQALITSKAQTNELGGGTTKGVRSVQALVDLVPNKDTELRNAIFANGTLSFDNKTTIKKSAGSGDADVYTNKNYSCANNENFAGSVYSQGSVTLQNGCTVASNVWAKTGIGTGGSSWNGNVAGFVKSSTGSIALNQGPGSVGGNLYAAGTIANGACPSRCFPNGKPSDPPYQPFPILRGDTATLNVWQSEGGYNVVTDNTCSSIATKIRTTYSQSGTPTLVKTSCLVSLTTSFSLKNDLAIFTYGGLTTGKLTLSSSSAGTKRDVHFVVPYDAATIPCSSVPMDTDKQFDFTSDIDLFVYSPCDITYRNQSTHIGQVYGGSNVNIRNQFTMTFKPVDVFGIDPTSLPTLGYTPSIVYKREVR